MSTQNTQAHILGLATDLFFAPTIDAAAAKIGFSTRWIDAYKTGPEFLADLEQNPPALIILDLNSSVPWVDWLPAAKAHKATRDIPWLVFGSHMNPRRLAAARHAGADKVVPKSQFSAELPELIQAMVK